MTPLLYVGGLSGRVFCTTRYTPRKGGQPLVVHDKHDITDQFEDVALELGWTPPSEDA